MRNISLIFLLSLRCRSLAMAQIDNTLVIAHRGASGYLPEHTMEAKVLAFAQDADFIEQDVVVTLDDQLVVFHDLTLERTTDVARRFPDRARADGSYYVIDFMLDELRTLHLSEGFTVISGVAVANYPNRFPIQTSRFGIHTLQEELELIRGLNYTSGKHVGIYPELKSPWFHHQHGKDLAAAVLQVLKDFGYQNRDAKIYLQSFDHVELLRVHDELLPAFEMDLPLIQLMAKNSWRETFTPAMDGTWQVYDYDWMFTPTGLKSLAQVVDGIGPSLDMIVGADSGQGALQISSLVDDAHAAGLQVHAYTFRSDRGQIPAYAENFEQLLDIFCFSIGIDGIFTDFPDQAVRFLQSRN